MKCLPTCLVAGSMLTIAWAGTSPAPRFDGPEVVKLDWSTRSLQAVDLDHDGQLDLAIVNNDRARIDLLIQTKPGQTRGAEPRRAVPLSRWEPVLEDARFTKDNFVTGITVHDLVVADLDGDQRPDLVYTGDPDALTVVRQKSDGTWGDKRVIEIAAPAPIVGNLRIGDLNGDGRPDIAVLGQKELSLLFQQSDSSFGRPIRYLLTEENLFGLTLTDLNQDGRVDLLYLANRSREPMRVRYQGRTAGEFGPELAYGMEPARSSVQVMPGGKKGEPPAFAYIEQRTGQLGVVALQPGARDGNPSRLGRPRVFSPRGAGRQGLSYAFADFNGDGRPDIAAGDTDSAQVFLYLRQGDEGFAPEAVFPSLADARAVAAADWDGDRRAELFIASGKEQLAGYTSLDADGRLAYPKPLPGKGRALAIAAGTLAPSQPAQVLVLREDAGKRWIDFITRGKAEPEIVRSLELSAQRGDPKALRLLDFNQDGRLDLAVFTPFDSLKLWVQSAEGNFTEASAAPGFRRGLVDNLDAGKVTTADVDGDGKDEVVVSSTGFARALRLNPEGELVIVDQFNGRDVAAEIGAALLLPPAKPGGAADFLLYERKSGEFQTLQRDDRKVYAFSSAQPAGRIDPVAAQVSRTPSGRTEILLFGADRFWWLPLDQTELEARKTSGYASDLRDISYADVFAADLNGDGRPELVCNDAEHNLIEVLSAEGPEGDWASRLHFSVFDRDAHVQQKRNSPFEPREMIVADVTGDKRPDLVLLVHDRVLLYPQAGPAK
ncbi:MAG TPA: VCBS repeat-containing protein [Lacunisphaera sp.]|nr:VCBS repeat-containing protein [Lacunisphaera sp.]